MNSILRFTCVTAIVFIALFTAPSVFAAAGWYLLIPPSSDFNERAEYLGGYIILDSKPLSQWAQQGAYDSASECEAVKNALYLTEQISSAKSNENYIKAVGENKEPSVLKFMRWTSERRNANVNAWAGSRCIKSDDPRLGK
jgi:hypothetical protein